MLKTAAVLAVEQIMFFRCTVSYICTKCQINYKIMEDLISYLMSMKSGIIWNITKIIDCSHPNKQKDQDHRKRLGLFGLRKLHYVIRNGQYVIGILINPIFINNDKICSEFLFR